MKELKVSRDNLIVSAKTFFFRDAYDFMRYLESFIDVEKCSLLFNKSLHCSKKEVFCYRMYESKEGYIFYTEDRFDLTVGAKVEIEIGGPTSTGVMPSRIYGKVERG